MYSLLIIIVGENTRLFLSTAASITHVASSGKMPEEASEHTFMFAQIFPSG